jgi:hypothetical protein
MLLSDLDAGTSDRIEEAKVYLRREVESRNKSAACFRDQLK